jgi:cytochrome c-type biogenesis protein
VLAELPIAFLAGLVSLITPCVLPLVPGYLSTVSAVEADRLGEAGSARRVLVGAIPFLAGFTVVFVLVGAAAASLAAELGWSERNAIAGFLVVVVGLTFMGLLPLPKRLVGAGLLGGAHRRGSSILLGAAFAVCATPCIGAVLGGVLVLAGGSGSALGGAAVLAAYSLGLACGFLLVGLAFARAMGAFRWLRDRYAAIQVASGALLVALGLLLFFDRFWWLRVLLNRALAAVGLDTV